MCNEIKKRAGGILVLCRVEFSKIGKRDVTFIREMRVNKRENIPTYTLILSCAIIWYFRVTLTTAKIFF